MYFGRDYHWHLKSLGFVLVGLLLGLLLYLVALTVVRVLWVVARFGMLLAF